MKFIFTALLLFCFSLGVLAQNLLSSKDLSSFKVDALTETEITQIQAQLQQAGMTIDQVEQQSLAKGMSPAEFAKLKSKLGNAKGSKINVNSPLKKIRGSKGRNTFLDSTDNMERASSENNINPLIYGSELFNQNGTGFGENQNIATPLNYEIGPNDVLKLVVYGVQEYSDDLTVSKEGFIQIKNVGQIKVAGLTIEATIDRLKNQMIKTAYSSIARGESKIALTLGDIRTIQVTIIGAAKSGNYNISSLSNVLSALTEAGGPSEIGSYRAIELIRNNKIFKTIDLYHFMQNGDQSQNIGLKDHDVIRVPPYKNRVEIKGQVKRPGVFELVGKENFSQFLNYAGGFDDTAYTSVVKVIQKSEKEKSVKDLAKLDFEKYQPNGGDVFIISKILDRFQNRVKLSGAVYRPDVYELSSGMRISDLIRIADGVKEDAYTGRAQLIRLKPNLLKELISINLGKALRNDNTENILLQREDELYINSVLDLRDSLAVDLVGEVRNPGRYVYLDSMTVKDLILMSGGFNYSANKSIEIARMVQFENKVDNNRVSTIFKTEINGDFSFTSGNQNLVLQPFDVVSITRKSGYTAPEVVMVNGQVQNVGKYTLRTRLERVSDIVTRAGGLIGDAYGEGAFIKRSKYVIDTLKADETKISIEEAYRRKFKSQQATEQADIQNQLDNSNNTGVDKNFNKKRLTDTINAIINDLNNDYYQIAIDINYIMSHPGSEDDLVLKDKDELVIPKLDNRIKISGGVLRPTNIVYRDGININDCISAAGGISEYAKRGRAYVVYANGKSNRTKHFGFFKISPAIKPGCELILPETNEKIEKPLSTILTFTTVLAQVFTAIATAKLLTK
jgi:protein involved in polysaccharide export with SLBB domain